MRAQRDEGFTLLETLIAFAILAVALGFLFQGFSSASKGLAKVEERQILLSLAETTLERIGSEIPLREGEHTGTFDLEGFSYAVKISMPEEEEEPVSGTLFVYDIEVAVFSEARRGAPVKLQSGRIGVY